MTAFPTALWCGDSLIENIFQPDPSHIDIVGIERNLWTAHRFSNDPMALKIRQHTWLVRELAECSGESWEVVQWCDHHDDHEGITGDMPGPLKVALRSEFRNTSLRDPITRLEEALDKAICAKRGIPYPEFAVRARVGYFDKLAETLEWQFVLRRGIADWNIELPHWLTVAHAETLVIKAAHRRAPRALMEAA